MVLERADEVGGTWRREPLPRVLLRRSLPRLLLLLRAQPHWERGFAPQAEILRYLKGCVDKYGIRPQIRFGHEVTAATWDETDRLWRLDTTGGPFTADVLVGAAGALSEPKEPDIPGHGQLQGTTFHSSPLEPRSRSRRRAGGGDRDRSIVDPVRAGDPADSGPLHLFQRTAPWVIPRLDHKITRAEHALLRIPYAPALVRAVLYWMLELRVVGFRHPRLMKAADRLARQHLRRQVPDRELQRKLLPGYIMGCKRILISDDYYPSLTRPTSRW